MSYHVNEKGYYGQFGGAFIPEMLYPNVEELRQNYLKVMAEPDFKKEFDKLLKDYVGRPTPLYFAKRMSKKYNTNIYLKREDLCHTGAHKINNTIGQILMAKRLKKTRIIAETGAGQHGVATATVCALAGLECIVYMGEIDIARQAPNVARMKMLGAEVRPALSGSRTLKDATNEAIRDWINNPVDTHYIIGSAVGPHPYPDMVARFQSVVSQETKWQLKKVEGLLFDTSLPNFNPLTWKYPITKDISCMNLELCSEGFNGIDNCVTYSLHIHRHVNHDTSMLLKTCQSIANNYSGVRCKGWGGVGGMYSAVG